MAITWWEPITDSINETGEPQGETVIEARVDFRLGENVKDLISRGMDECYSYIDPDGYYCAKNLPHPTNSTRRALLRPVYCSAFQVDESKSAPNLFLVKLQWAVPERIQGGIDLERYPPERGQWSETRQSLYDPNTNRLHQTTAGELIRNIEVVRKFPSFRYQYRTEQLPNWFLEAQEAPINEDYLRLDGVTYEPFTIAAQTCTATILRGEQPGEFWREVDIELAHDPDGWDRMQPNIGYYEYRLNARSWTPAKNDQGATFYKLGENNIDVYPYIEDQSDVDRFITAARENRAVKLAKNGIGPTVKILVTYERIVTIINPSGDQESKEVDKPVPLDNNGVAYRIWKPGFDYVAGATTKPYPLSLRTRIDPSELIMLRPRPMKLARMSLWGLW